MLVRDDVERLSIDLRGPPGRDTGGDGRGPGDGERDEAVDLREGVLMEEVLRDRADRVRGRMLVEALNADGGGEVGVAEAEAGSSASVHCRCKMTDLVAHCR